MRGAAMMRRRGLLLASGILLAGCQLSPSAAPASSPTPSGVGPPGTASPAATIPSNPTRGPSKASAVSGTSYEVGCDQAGTCLIHHLAADGTDVPGSPVSLGRDGSCAHQEAPGVSWSSRSEIGPDGTVFLAYCDGRRLAALDGSGRVKPGWPVELSSPLGDLCWNDFSLECSEVPAVQVAADGSVYAWITSGPLEGQAASGQASLVSLSPDGTVRAGWPVPFPAAGCPGYSLQPSLTVYAWWNEGGVSPSLICAAERTMFTAIGADGRTLPGWPQGADGATSGPLVAAVGTLYYVTGGGDVYAREPTGEIRSGWPVTLPGSTAPYMGPDGTLAFVFSRGPGDSQNVVIRLLPNGQAAAGWPYRPSLDLETGCALGGTPCSGRAIGPAFGPDGTMYVALAGRASDQVVALDLHGAVRPGWPVTLPPPVRVTRLEITRDGWLLVHAGTVARPTGPTFTVDPEGRIVTEPTP